MDDDEETERLYENGHWEWDEYHNQLQFISTEKESKVERPLPKILGPIVFRDVDIVEQQRFKKRYQRKAAEDDVITLQDVKDVVLFTAPMSILSVSVVKMLHLPSTERFLRALILFCQYYLQITDLMTQRSIDLLTQVRTLNSVKTEMTLHENLQELRLLVAKEYTCMILGIDGYRNFHHMGPEKKRRSQSQQDAALFETILLIAIQIVWIALGRKSFHKIELEINRMFKSPTYNIAEHNLKTEYASKLTPEESFVLHSHYDQRGNKLNIRSPLMDEIRYHRDQNYKIFGLGVIEFPRLSSRLRFMENALKAPEDRFNQLNMSLGIIGLPRSRFDTMLKLLPSAPVASSSSVKSAPGLSRTVKASQGIVRKSAMVVASLYPDIVLPDKTSILMLESSHEFPSSVHVSRPCDTIQRNKWLARLKSVKYYTPQNAKEVKS